MNKLIGKTVIRATYDGDSIYLDCGADGIYKLEPEGDCCASCYIEHVAGSNAFPGTILNVLSVGSSTEAEDYDNGEGVSSSWGHLFVTDKGHCTVEMRVTHNGYYGGWCNVRKVGATVGATLDEV